MHTYGRGCHVWHGCICLLFGWGKCTMQILNKKCFKSYNPLVSPLIELSSQPKVALLELVQLFKQAKFLFNLACLRYWTSLRELLLILSPFYSLNNGVHLVPSLSIDEWINAQCFEAVLFKVELKLSWYLIVNYTTNGFGYIYFYYFICSFLICLCYVLRIGTLCN